MKKFCVLFLTIFSIAIVGSIATFGVREVDK